MSSSSPRRSAIPRASESRFPHSLEELAWNMQERGRKGALSQYPGSRETARPGESPVHVTEIGRKGALSEHRETTEPSYYGAHGQVLHPETDRRLRQNRGLQLSRQRFGQPSSSGFLRPEFYQQFERKLQEEQSKTKELQAKTLKNFLARIPQPSVQSSLPRSSYGLNPEDRRLAENQTEEERERRRKAGRKGGKATLRKYGTEYFRGLAKKRPPRLPRQTQSRSGTDSEEYDQQQQPVRSSYGLRAQNEPVWFKCPSGYISEGVDCVPIE